MDQTRKTAFLVLKDVEERKAYSNIALANHIKVHRPPNVPFIRELVYGVVRNALYLDYIISQFVKTPIDKLTSTDLTLLEMGLYQLIFMNSVPDHAAVDETVEIAKYYAKGKEGFVNGVLRQYLRDKDYVKLPDRAKDLTLYLSTKYSFEPWIIDMWLKEYGEEKTEELATVLNETPQLCIRTNTLKIDSDALTKRLEAQGIKVERDEDYPDLLVVQGENVLSNKMFSKEGLFSVQDKGSQTVVEWVDAKPGETVIDVCAAPGGKTVAIAEDMKNIGVVKAFDIYLRKISLIEAEAERLGISIIRAWSWDATRIDSTLLNQADKVLVDAPCSGLGTARRKPEVKYKRFDNKMKNLPTRQFDILKASANYVKPGGILIYSTCTIAKRENEDVVQSFINSNWEFEILEKVQLLPQTSDTDGFFICKMKRKEKR
ncbi:MAG: 16S rRNA (cytosine(967)-C(5))-methyltransferase RsmB [Clostridiales Family XIII bacterium]|jgi:16S rRNA (cytosine967-C5)-methyltransferase|nr:16S rRNA (cytosine(967)-C(5))-methyltransferase RsmB [Clostridiales Family XIII bacterium]